MSATWLGGLFTPKHNVRIYDIDLEEDWVLIENLSRSPISMGSFCLCDEDRTEKLQFSAELIIEPRQFLKVAKHFRAHCSCPRPFFSFSPSTCKRELGKQRVPLP
jgi:hypothetical protein